MLGNSALDDVIPSTLVKKSFRTEKRTQGCVALFREFKADVQILFGGKPVNS